MANSCSIKQSPESDSWATIWAKLARILDIFSDFGKIGVLGRVTVTLFASGKGILTDTVRLFLFGFVNFVREGFRPNVAGGRTRGLAGTMTIARRRLSLADKVERVHKSFRGCLIYTLITSPAQDFFQLFFRLHAGGGLAVVGAFSVTAVFRMTARATVQANKGGMEGFHAFPYLGKTLDESVCWKKMV